MPHAAFQHRGAALLTLAVLAGATAAAAFALPHVARDASGPLDVAAVRMEAGAHYLTGLADGRVEATLVIDLRGPGIIARLARAIEVDVAIEGIPLGRLVAERASAFLDAPARFEIPLRADLTEGSEAATHVGRAISKHPGKTDVEVSGQVYLAFGGARTFRVAGLAPIDSDPTRPSAAVDPIAFSS